MRKWLAVLLLLTGCNVWIIPIETDNDDSLISVEVEAEPDPSPQPKPLPLPQPTPPEPVDDPTDVAEFDDGLPRVLFWRESDNSRPPEWLVLIQNGERWAVWVDVHQAEYRIWDTQQILGAHESDGWKVVRETYHPDPPVGVVEIMVFDGKRVAVNGPVEFTSADPAQQVEDLIRFIESSVE